MGAATVCIVIGLAAGAYMLVGPGGASQEVAVGAAGVGPPGPAGRPALPGPATAALGASPANILVPPCSGPVMSCAAAPEPVAASLSLGPQDTAGQFAVLAGGTITIRLPSTAPLRVTSLAPGIVVQSVVRHGGAETVTLLAESGPGGEVDLQSSPQGGPTAPVTSWAADIGVAD